MNTVEHLSFLTNKPQTIQTMGGDETYFYFGKCQCCLRSIYATLEGDPDPRGPAGEKHSRSTAIASEYGMKGPDILFCYNCFQNDGETYKRCVAIAKERWLPK